jgi:alkylation response protein AidB-like acyl-CoA dehydrogenase
MRLVVEECLKWSHQRIVFGKRLIDQPVVRQKLARMIALCESHQAWLESLTYQMCHMPYAEQSRHLGGPVGLLKMSCTKAAHEIAGEAVQIWGGRGLTQTGMGRVIENFSRTVKFDAILVCLFSFFFFRFFSPFPGFLFPGGKEGRLVSPKSLC